MANQSPIDPIVEPIDATADIIVNINNGIDSPLDLLVDESDRDTLVGMNDQKFLSGILEEDILIGSAPVDQTDFSTGFLDIPKSEEEHLTRHNSIHGDQVVKNQYTVNALQRLAGKFKVGDEFAVVQSNLETHRSSAEIVDHQPDVLHKFSRNYKVILTGALSLVAKGGSAIANIVSLPLLAQYLGQERFGIWLVASSFLTWSSIADLGLANTLKNNLAESDGQRDVQRAIQAITSTVFAIGGLTAILLAAFLMVNPFIPWLQIFNVQQGLAEISTFGLVCGLLFVARIPLAIPNQIYSGYQEGYYYQVISGFTSLLALAMLGLATKMGGDLSALAWAFFGTMMAADVLAGWHLFARHRPELFPSWENFDLPIALKIIRSGIQIWVAQIASIAVFQTDLIIVAQLFGAQEVAIYGVVLRLFSLISFLQGAFLYPLWPAYTEAAARGDRAWILKTFRRSIILSLGVSLTVGGILAIAVPYLVKMWINPNTQVDILLLLAMFSTAVLSTVSTAIGILANGLGEIKFQATIAPIFALFNLGMSILLGKLLGAAGVAIATAIGIFIFSVLAVGGNLRFSIRSGTILPR
jgi:O-antigen/teichoic acid export membrane protein